MSTDTEWEKWGKEDPYFGVLTNDKFRVKNFTEEVKKEFFESGKKEIEHVLEICRRHVDEGFSPGKALDFGCGVGRLLIPLAEIAEHVVGVDVSGSMLNEARRNCNEYSVKNVSLLKSDDNLTSLAGCFDFIHSVIVFQHIPVDRGRRIFKKLLQHLEEGGICAIQFTYSKAIYKKKYGAPPSMIYGNNLFKIIKKYIRRVMNKGPEMQMNLYNVNELLFLVQSAGIEKLHVAFTDHGGELGFYLCFQKPRKT